MRAYSFLHARAGGDSLVRIRKQWPLLRNCSSGDFCRVGFCLFPAVSSLIGKPEVLCQLYGVFSFPAHRAAVKSIISPSATQPEAAVTPIQLHTWGFIVMERSKPSRSDLHGFRIMPAACLVVTDCFTASNTFKSILLETKKH